MTEEIRYIVRIASKDLDGTLPIARALWGIKGISQRTSHIIAYLFEKETGIKTETQIGKISEDKDKVLEDIVLNPIKHGMPAWAVNRQKEFDDNKPKHLVMNELDFALRTDLVRLGNIKSYRGLRHVWRLPVRGQRTKSTHRGKGAAVGVIRKDAKVGKG